MDREQKKLWYTLSNLQVRIAGAEYSFIERLQDENGWSTGYTERVVDEYRRFLFLCAVAGHAITPSEPVDQVWHMHLTYTHNYWGYLCANVLGFPLHHGPTKGGITEKVKYKDQYIATLESYQKFFDETPPIDVWPNVDKRFQDLELRRISLEDTYVFKKPQFYPYRYAILAVLSGIIAILFGSGELGGFLIALGVLISFAVYYVRSQRTGNEGAQYGCDDTGGCGSYTTWTKVGRTSPTHFGGL